MLKHVLSGALWHQNKGRSELQGDGKQSAAEWEDSLQFPGLVFTCETENAAANHVRPRYSS